jgi:proteasome lid subunit RPN8/RPN11
MFTIPRSVYQEMIAHAKAGYPNEACGLLGGSPGNSRVFYPMLNRDDASISYFMDPTQQLKVMKKMREGGMDLCGIFHSHVASEAYPSEKDVRLAFYGDKSTEIFPEASYLIVSLSDTENPVLRSFKIAQEKVTEEEIKIEN